MWEGVGGVKHCPRSLSIHPTKIKATSSSFSPRARILPQSPLSLLLTLVTPPSKAP